MKRAAALLYGIVSHLIFLAATVSMALALHGGLQNGRGALSGLAALVMNVLLLVQFPLIHSWLLARRGRVLLSRLLPAGRELVTTTYMLSASVQLFLVFYFWSPTGIVWYEAHGILRVVHEVAFISGWLFLGVAMIQAGASVQFGYHGWVSVVRQKPLPYPPMPERGLFRVCRQPIYLSFALTLWAGPVWTPDKLLLAVPWTCYCIFGPLLKERRYLQFFGDKFRAYQERVPCYLPFVKLRPRVTDCGQSAPTISAARQAGRH